jgi:hypothetical protein
MSDLTSRNYGNTHIFTSRNQNNSGIIKIKAGTNETLNIEGTVTGAAGTNGQIMFNDSGLMAGDAGLVYDNFGKALEVGILSKGVNTIYLDDGFSSNLAIASAAEITMTNTTFVSDATVNGQLFLTATNNPIEPPLTFVGDNDTGIYRQAANVLGFSVGSKGRMTLSDDSLTLGVDQGKSMSIKTPAATSGNLASGALTIVTGNSFGNGSSGDIILACGSSPGTGIGSDVTIKAGNNTGGGVGGDIVLSVGAGATSNGKIYIGSALIVDAESDITTSNHQIQSYAGTAAFPAYSFISQPDMGMSKFSATEMRLSTQGVGRLEINATSVSVGSQLRALSGSAAVPSLSFIASPTTGFYIPATDQLSISLLGGQYVNFNTVENVFFRPLRQNTISIDNRYTDFFAIDGITVLGSIRNAGNSGVSYTSVSDRRLKENIVSLTNGCGLIKTLLPRNYTWKATGKEDFGFIASELQSVLPSAVVGEVDALKEDGTPDYQQVDTNKIIPFLVCSIKEMISKIETMELEILTLKAHHEL